jgi:hypothetical protein
MPLFASFVSSDLGSDTVYRGVASVAGKIRDNAAADGVTSG